MSIASAAVRTTVTTSGQHAAASYGSASRTHTVLEVQITQVNATAQSLGLYTNSGVATVSASVTFRRDDSADPACATVLVTAWTAAPAAATTYLRRWNSAAAVGLGVVWSFPAGLISRTVAIENATAGDVCDVSMIIDE